MAFADNATLLVLEKDIGNIRKITDGLLEKEPVLQVNVDNTAERGLLGIAVLREENRESKDSKAILSNDYISSTASSSLNTMFPSSLSSSISSYCNCSLFIYFTQESEDTRSSHNNISVHNKSRSQRKPIYKYKRDGKFHNKHEQLVDLHSEPGHYNN